MGAVYANIQLRSNGRALKRRLLVDTGAAFTWIRESSLKKLGIKPTDWERFETIEGKNVRRRLGQVQVETLGRKAFTVVVFAEESDSQVLGLHALEGLRLEVDPANRALRRCRAVKAL